MKQYHPVLILIYLSSCGDSTSNVNEADVANDSLKIVQTGPVEPDTIPAPQYFSFTDTVTRAAVLNIGTYHGDEVSAEELEEKWYGIFYGEREGDGTSLKQIILKVNRVYDPSDEDESSENGWEIEHEGFKDPVVLISAADLSEQELERVDMPAQFFPGDSISFEYHDVNYLIFATGTKLRNENNEVSAPGEYLLFLEAEKNGEKVTQLLVGYDFFDEGMVSIMFCGDLDGDFIPDLVLNNVYKYNSLNPTLYLSGETEEDKLLHIVGWRKSYGC